jgi:putative tryptophan/tyrosine transport system substrate-binding protein
MKRREFITLLGGAAAAWPLAVRGEQPRRVPVVGVLWHAANAEEEVAFSSPLKAGFADLGYIEGKTIVFEERYPAEQKERFDAYAVELVGLKVDALIAGSIPAAFACQRATSTIPIILVANPDPVGLKLVSSLARPGGNITGLSAMAFDLAAKRVQLLKEAIPALSHVALLVNPSDPNDANRLISELQPTADNLQVSFQAFEARSPDKLQGAFERISAGHFGAVVVTQNAMYFNERRQIADIALANRIPTMVPADVFVEAGALMSYGPSWPAIFRNAAGYVDRIFKGAKPADLPVQQPTKFELAINLKTAKALGQDVPPTMITRADKVIE